MPCSACKPSRPNARCMVSKENGRGRKEEEMKGEGDAPGEKRTGSHISDETQSSCIHHSVPRREEASSLHPLEETSQVELLLVLILVPQLADFVEEALLALLTHVALHINRIVFGNARAAIL